MMRRLFPFLCLLLLFAGKVQAADLLSSIVEVQARIPGDARTAESLGSARTGSGMVITEGRAVLTVGYVILEADAVTLRTADGRQVPGEIMAYDHETGFGLVRPMRDLGVPALELGDSSQLKERDRVLIAGHGGSAAAQPALVTSRRTFAGYWEYLLENAIFTSPPYENFAGAALIDQGGRLVGVGSLIVGDAVPGLGVPGNMFIPVEALLPILEPLMETGRSPQPPRPWLGLQLDEERGRLFVRRVSPDSPADLAGLKRNDLVLGIGGTPTATLADFYRALWRAGEPGSIATIQVLDGLTARPVEVRTGNRYRYLKLNRTY
ncbi:S1C family serine protease [Oceanibaculum indicum]|uniref:S1C family serine protease n=1 Tax=Oceanibaculum indicum TaxID=526216 RepID=UPI00178C20FB|nr:S1C family serine protease [Oceanibaculum indicum]